jgi:hypothetical protein
MLQNLMHSFRRVFLNSQAERGRIQDIRNGLRVSEDTAKLYRQPRFLRMPYFCPTFRDYVEPVRLPWLIALYTASA